MAMYKMKTNPVSALILIILLLIVLNAGYSGLRLMSSFSYTTGYEGVKARFAGLKTSSEKITGSLWSATFNYDFDSATSGMPDLTGEMTSVFLPKESLGEQPYNLGGKDITAWLLNTAQINNPVKRYEWELTSESNTTLYVMEEWELRWFVSIGIDPDLPNEIPYSTFPTHIYKRLSLRNVEVWFELDLEPIWYFEGQDTAYFAIAKLSLAENTALGGNYEGEEYNPDEKNSELSVTPMSKGSIVGIYYGLFGADGNRAEKEAFIYQDRRLNPTLFTDKVYAKLTLNDFGVSSWYAYGNHWRSDVATFALKMRVFVIGQWTVQDIDDLPDDYGRESKTGGLNVVGGNPIIQWLATPEGQFLLYIFIGLIVLLVFAILAPTFLLGLFAILGGKRK